MEVALFIAAVAAGVTRAVIAYLEYRRKRAGPEFAITSAAAREFLERLVVVFKHLQVRVQVVVRVGLPA